MTSFALCGVAEGAILGLMRKEGLLFSTANIALVGLLVEGALFYLGVQKLDDKLDALETSVVALQTGGVNRAVFDDLKTDMAERFDSFEATLDARLVPIYTEIYQFDSSLSTVEAVMGQTQTAESLSTPIPTSTPTPQQ